MSLIEIVLASTSWLPPESRDAGFLLLARLGRYAQDVEREAAYLLHFFRAHPDFRERCSALVQNEARDILLMLSIGTTSAQVERVIRQGALSAGRILYCDLLERIETSELGSGGVALHGHISRLTTALESEVFAGIKADALSNEDVAALFAPRHKALFFSHSENQGVRKAA